MTLHAGQGMHWPSELTRLQRENERIKASNKWLVDRLRDAVSTCYGGVSQEDIDAYEDKP